MMIWQVAAAQQLRRVEFVARRRSFVKQMGKVGGASIRIEDKKRRTTFRPILDSPYHLKWPKVFADVLEEIMSTLCRILEDSETNKKSMTIGINATTNALQRQCNSASKTLGTDRKEEICEVVFVAKDDLAPAHLYDHLPMLIGTLNHKGAMCRLVPLPAGSHDRIRTALKFKNAGVIGVSSGGNAELIQIVQKRLEPFRLPWFDKYQPTTIKHIKSTAPIKEKEKKTV